MGDFLKLEWKKFVLPIVLIAAFFVLINAFHIEGSASDKYDCQIASLLQESINYTSYNNTVSANEANNKISTLSDEKQNKLESLKYSKPILITIRMIDPITPIPCESLEKSNVCEFYISEDTYNCYKSLDFTGNLFSGPSMSKYRHSSLIITILNVLLLFIEGYLLSSIILFFYRKIANRSEVQSII